MTRLRIAADFNGTIHDHADRAKFHLGPLIPSGAYQPLGSPEIPGAIEWLKSVSEEFDVFLLSASFIQPPAIIAAKNWLAAKGIPRPWMEPINDQQPRITITPFKPACVMFLDDRGFQFRGVYPTLEQIKAFKPWNR